MSGAGKGSTPRPVNPTIYGDNYNDIFRKNECQNKPKMTDSSCVQEGQDSNLGNNESLPHLD
jgi:hypothetical protein